MNDIANDSDIELLVHTFYERVNEDAMLSPAFNVATNMNWDTHLPRMVAFWRTIIFRQPGYKGNPFSTHNQLKSRMDLTPAHFVHWVELFQVTVDDLFIGERATFAKQSAQQMGRGLTHNLFDGREVFNPIL